ncbi:hypothetical protein ACTFIZ_004198 [Dictyostelium cf. discoideum]
MADPVETNPRIYERIQLIKDKVLNECDESPIQLNGEKKISKDELNKIKLSKINSWIEYITQVIQIICSTDSKDYINYHYMIKHHQVINLNIFNEVKEETPLNYFAIFMGILQDTLSHLYIKLDSKETTNNIIVEFQELTEKDLENIIKTKTRPNKNKKIINHDQVKIEAAVIQREEFVTKDVVLNEPEDEKENNEKIEESLSIGRKLISEGPKFLISIFNLIRFNKLDQLLKTNPNSNLYFHVEDFKREINEKSKTPFNIDPFFERLKEHSSELKKVVHDDNSCTPYNVLYQILHIFNSDNEGSTIANDLFHGKTKYVCTKCNQLSKESFEISFNFNFSVEEISCNKCKKETPHRKYLETSPDCLVIELNRNYNNIISYSRFHNPNEIIIGDIFYKNSDIKYTHHSTIMIDNSINISTDDINGSKKIKCTADSCFSFIDKDEYYKEEQLISHLLIYKKSNLDTPGDNQNENQNGDDDNGNHSTLEIDDNDNTKNSNTVTSRLNSSNPFGLTKDDLIKDYNDKFFVWVSQLPLDSGYLGGVVDNLKLQEIQNFDEVFNLNDDNWNQIIPIFKIKKSFLDHLDQFN